MNGQGRLFLLLSVGFPVHLSPSVKVSALEGMNFLPRGANSFLVEKEGNLFLCRVDPFKKVTETS